MLVYKSTRDSRISALLLVCTGIFVVDVLNLLPTTKGKGIIAVVNSISVHPDTSGLGLSGGWSWRTWKKSSWIPLSFQTPGTRVTIWELYIHDNLSFKSLHLNGWENYKEFLMSSCAHKYVSKKSCNQESNYASIQSLRFWVLSQSADTGF